MRSLLSVLVGIVIGFGLIQYQDRVYLNGMFVDSELLETLTYDQKEVLTQNHVFQAHAIYKEGSEAYVVNGQYPNFVSMHAGLWSKDFTTIHGSSHSSRERDAVNVSVGSGMVFHTINGKLYAYSSGEIRDNPDKFKTLISELVDQVEELAEVMSAQPKVETKS